MNGATEQGREVSECDAHPGRPGKPPERVRSGDIGKRQVLCPQVQADMGREAEFIAGARAGGLPVNAFRRPCRGLSLWAP